MKHADNRFVTSVQTPDKRAGILKALEFRRLAFYVVAMAMILMQAVFLYIDAAWRESVFVVAVFFLVMGVVYDVQVKILKAVFALAVENKDR